MAALSPSGVVAPLQSDVVAGTSAPPPSQSGAISVSAHSGQVVELAPMQSAVAAPVQSGVAAPVLSAVTAPRVFCC